MQQTNTNKLLLTGAPGCGKTTVIVKLAQLLNGKKIAGFHTREIRQGGQRTGFALETFSGKKTVLSSVSFKSGPRVGKYRVDLESFENLLEDITDNIKQAQIIMIDEIGKMECFSQKFIKMIEQIFERNIPVVATVSLKGSGLISEIKQRKDTKLINVTTGTRDELPFNIKAQLGF